MRHGTVLAVALMAAIGLCRPVAAQTTDAARLQRFTASPFYQGLINHVLAGLPAAVFRRCPTLVAHESQVTVLRPVTFAGDGFPVAGTWHQGFPMSGCGNDTVLNFYFTADAREKINTIIGLPGATHADPLLQRDAYRIAATGAMAAVQGCRSFVVRDTRFEGFGAPSRALPDPGLSHHGAPGAPWRESWTLAGCGQLLEMPMEFVPDATGTQIIQPGRVVRR